MPPTLFDRLRQAWQRFDHGQQIALSILAPCAVLTLALTAVSLRSSVVMPFRASRSLLTNSEALLKSQQQLAAQQAQSQAYKDTDGDGLSDQDETNTFRTSPYLTDTDSDGVPDGDEVRLGTDPNCAPDRDCYGTIVANPDAVPQASPTSTQSGAGGMEPPIERPLPPDQITPLQIRAYLIRNNLATQGQLDALPDDAVIELYRRAYADLQGVEQASQAPAPSGSSSTTSTSSL